MCCGFLWCNVVFCRVPCCVGFNNILFGILCFPFNFLSKSIISNVNFCGSHRNCTNNKCRQTQVQDQVEAMTSIQSHYSEFLTHLIKYNKNAFFFLPNYDFKNFSKIFCSNNYL